MVDSYTSSNRFAIQTVGGNDSTWGTIINALTTVLDEALDGVESISVTSGNVTLSTDDNATDQARKRCLIFTGSPGATRTVTPPDQEKIYFLINNSDSTVTFGNLGGTDVSLAASSKAIVYLDGATNAASILYITSVASSLLDDAAASNMRTTLGVAIGSDVQAYDADLAAIAGLTSAADKLPYFTGSGTAATTDFTSFGRSLVDDADASTARATLGVAIGSDVQAYDAELAAIAGLTSAADRLPYFTGSGTASLATFTSAGRAILDDANATAQRATLGVVIGTDVLGVTNNLSDLNNATTARQNLGVEIGVDVQAYDAELAAIAGLISAADKLPYFTGSGTAGLADLSSFGRTLIDDADASAARTTLGVGTVGTYASTSAALEAIGSTQGNILYHNGTAWVALAPGSDGQVLKTGGAGANVAWEDESGGGGGGTVTSVGSGSGLTGGPITTTGTLSVDTNGITNGLFRQSGALAVVGRATNSTGDVADIQATASSGAVLRESGSTLAFGTVTTAGIANSAITYAKIQNVSATDKILGRSSAGAGVVEEIACTSAGRALLDDADASAQRTTLGLGTAAIVNTGTSGGTIPLLNGANTWSGLQTLSSGGNLTPASTPATTSLGYLGTPHNDKDTTYTLVMSDAGRTIYHTSTAHTYTIPANASVPFPIGTIICIDNENGAGDITLNITSDTLRWGSNTGSRTIGANGCAAIKKQTATVWRLVGTEIS